MIQDILVVGEMVNAIIVGALVKVAAERKCILGVLHFAMIILIWIVVLTGVLPIAMLVYYALGKVVLSWGYALLAILLLLSIAEELIKNAVMGILASLEMFVALMGFV